MVRCMFFPIILLTLLLFAPVVRAEEPLSVYDAIQGGKETQTTDFQDKDQQNRLGERPFSLFPFLVKLLLSLIFIIFLIYALLKFLATKTRRLQSSGPLQVLGGCTLGANRSVQIVHIGQTIYILGVGENVQLLRAIDPGDEYDMILSHWEQPSPISSPFDLRKWIQKEDRHEQHWDSIFQAKWEELQRSDSSVIGERQLQREGLQERRGE